MNWMNTEENLKTDGDKTKSSPLSDIEGMGCALMENDGTALSCMTIIGQIEGHHLLGEGAKATKYEHILPMLCAVEENPDIAGLLVLINTVGGDVEAGLAIAEMLSSMSKPTASIVIGGGHSIGIPIAVACDRSFIVPSATMTIHPVRTQGTILGVPQAFKGLEKMQNRITRFIVEHSKIPARALEALIYRTEELTTDVGSIIDGDEATALGLIDETGGLSSAIAYLKKEARSRRKDDKRDIPSAEA